MRWKNNQRVERQTAGEDKDETCPTSERMCGFLHQRRRLGGCPTPSELGSGDRPRQRRRRRSCQRVVGEEVWEVHRRHRADERGLGGSYAPSSSPSARSCQRGVRGFIGAVTGDVGARRNAGFSGAVGAVGARGSGRRFGRFGRFGRFIGAVSVPLSAGFGVSGGGGG